jgi:small subunit ribosomal protein S20
MAVHKSAKKRIRRNARKAVENKSRISETRSGIRKVEEAIKSGDPKAAQDALKAAQPNLQRAAGKGLIHKKTASRKLSRLSARIKALKTKK